MRLLRYTLALIAFLIAFMGISVSFAFACAGYRVHNPHMGKVTVVHLGRLPH